MHALIGRRSAGGQWLRELGDTETRWDEATADGARLSSLFACAIETTYAMANSATDNQVRQSLFILCRGLADGSASATEEDPAVRIDAAIQEIGDRWGGNRGFLQRLSTMDEKVLAEAHDLWVQPISAFHVYVLAGVWSTLCKHYGVTELPRYLSLMLAEDEVDVDDMLLPEVPVLRRLFWHARAAPPEVRTGALRRLRQEATRTGQPWSEDAFLRREDPPRDGGGTGGGGRPSLPPPPMDGPSSVDGSPESTNGRGPGSTDRERSGSSDEWEALAP